MELWIPYEDPIIKVILLLLINVLSNKSANSKDVNSFPSISKVII